MKIGIILFILGLLLIAILLKIKFTENIIKNIGIFVAIIATIYGLILMVQPNEDRYFTYTKTTIAK
jgi:xanthine/uracil/vitamin C permease (AzgA family)